MYDRWFSQFFFFFMHDRSRFHHLLVCGTGFVSGTTSSIVSCSVIVRKLTASWKSVMFGISLGGGLLARFSVSCSLNSFQSVIRKLRVRVDTT